MTAEPPLGTIGVVSTARAKSWRTRIAARVIQYVTQSPCNHAFVATGSGRILEARGSGAQFTTWDFYKDAIWLTNITPPPQAPVVQAAVALSLRGTPYNFLDLLAIGIAQRRWSAELRQEWLSGHEPWWVKRVARPDRLICSQLCDLYYLRLGVHLFSDGRLPGLVSPGDLLQLDRANSKS